MTDKQLENLYKIKDLCCEETKYCTSCYLKLNSFIQGELIKKGCIDDKSNN